MDHIFRIQSLDALQRQIESSLREGLIADVPCNDCPDVHRMDIIAGASAVERSAADTDLTIRDSRNHPVCVVRVRGGGESGHATLARPGVRKIEFHLTAKRRGRANRRRRPSLDEALAVQTRQAELEAGRLYVDQHNLVCPRPRCINCRETMPLRTVSIRLVSCWECGEPVRIALGTINEDILYLDQFTQDERSFAEGRGGVKLRVQSSSAFGDRYLANVCGGCDSVQGDWTLDVDVHRSGQAVDGRSEYGPCACVGVSDGE